MFVTTKRFRSNPKSIIYNKSFPMGSISERGVDPILDRFVNPKGKLAYKNIFLMTKEKEFVSGNAVCVTVTPAQQRLLQLLKGPEAQDFADSLRTVHYNGTYGVTVEEFCPSSSRYTHLLLDAVQALATENYFTYTKS